MLKRARCAFMRRKFAGLFFPGELEDELPFLVGYGLARKAADADECHVGEAFILLDLIQGNGLM